MPENQTLVNQLLVNQIEKTMPENFNRIKLNGLIVCIQLQLMHFLSVYMLKPSFGISTINGLLVFQGSFKEKKKIIKR